MGLTMNELAMLASRLAELERRVSASSLSGTVAEVDAAAGTIRLKLGDASSGGDFLSPHIPYAQIGGALKAHIPPSIGQQFALFSPSGDMAQGVAMPLGFSGASPSPSSSGSENVITFGAARITLDAGALTIEVGGVTLEISGGGVTITGGVVTHDGLNIGSTHTHGGVVPGGANTSGPN